MSASYWDDTIAWYENEDGLGQYGQQQVITAPTAAGARFVRAVDLDSDGDLDVLSTSSFDNKIAWYENTDERGSFAQQKVITSEARGNASIFVADLDGDDDVDILAAVSGYGDAGVTWYENDGRGSFGQSREVTRPLGRIAGPVFAADFDGDGDLDVLASSSSGGKFAQYENEDGHGSFGRETVIDTDAFFGSAVHVADVDGDGDVDVISEWGQNSLAWSENVDGEGNFSRPHTISENARFVTSVSTADIDGDGDADVVLGSSANSRVTWYENTDGSGSFFGPERLITAEAKFIRSVFTFDLDGDGDVDVLSASRDDDRIAWYENHDGKGSFGPLQVIRATATGAQSVHAADIDGDGDADVVSAANDTIAWYENLAIRFAAGDANKDWQFDQLDIVRVLQEGKYLTGEAASFQQGDWNGDNLFDQLDIVVALQTGNYLQGPYVEPHG